MPDTFKIELVAFDDLAKVIGHFNAQAAFPILFSQLGTAFVRDIKNRIVSQDGGKWKPASKWILAKKGTTKALRGMERFIIAKVKRDRVEIGSDYPDAHLGDHHEGFTNDLIGPNDRVAGKAVILNLVRPSALGLKRRGEFRFAPVKKGKTPARKIWPTDREGERLSQPIASRWLQQTLRNAGAL